MVRLIVVLLSLTLACYPAQAVAPAVLIAKEIVKQIIFDFVRGAHRRWNPRLVRPLQG